MNFDKLIKPAICLMNRLPFKFKIIAAVSIPLLLLILPTHRTVTNYIDKTNIYKMQLIGLSYSNHIQEVIESVQVHRGLSNSYFNGNKIVKKDILNIEDRVKQKLKNLFDFDNKNLILVKHNKNFVKAISSFELVKLKNISKEITAREIFTQHSGIVTNLIKTFLDISVQTSFANSEDTKINYIANTLQEKLLLLQENSGQVRGIAAGIFSKNRISKEEKSQLQSLSTLIKSLETYILDNQVLIPLDSYFTIQKNAIFAFSKLDEVLNTINKNIFLVDIPTYDNKVFFTQATSAISEQKKLYKILSKSYKTIVTDLQNKIFLELFFVLLGFFVVMTSSLYVFVAFYKSIAQSLTKLREASKLIAEGKTNIFLESDTKDEVGEALLAFNDMSKKLDENISFLNGYKMAIDETTIVSKSDTRGIITYVNELFCTLSGYSEKELMGMPHSIIRHPDMPEEAFADMWNTIKDKKIWKGIVKNRTKSGETYIVDATIIPILDSENSIIEYVAVRHDITEIEKNKEEIQKQKIDLLTGLPNRSQLIDDLVVAKKPILLYLNIDDFANLNDFYGSKMGDQVLIHLSELLNEFASNTDCKLYKLHADEFVILFEEGILTKDNYQFILEETINYIEAKTIDCDAATCVSITISGGVAFYDLSDHFEDLLSYSFMARKVAKSENKKFMLYSSGMRKDDDYQNNITWVNKIKDAIADDRIVTFFQPLIDNKTGAITKYESLVRMIGTDGKVVSPFFFLDISKKAKLYTKITKIVIDKSFATFEKLPKYEFSLNITVEDINDEYIPSYIFEKLSTYPNAKNVIFEITESEEIADYAPIKSFIERVKSFGARIAIDDFGSGYANFEHIISLKADFIKIDGSLIKNIDKDRDSQIITEAIIAFSKKLGSKTVVEFVHNEAVYEKVKEMGADFSQGFYLGEPKPELVSMEDILVTQEV